MSAATIVHAPRITVPKIEEALSPLHSWMPEPELARLILAIRSATGIEARVWLTDVAGLSSDDAIELMRWSARAMYQSAVAEHGMRPERKRRRP